jgi:hypothetical protein
VKARSKRCQSDEVDAGVRVKLTHSLDAGVRSSLLYSSGAQLVDFFDSYTLDISSLPQTYECLSSSTPDSVLV